MKPLFSLIRQDLMLTWRNGLIFFTGLLLLIMLGLIWLLPESLNTEATEVIYDQSADGHFENYLRQMGAGDEIFVTSSEELQAVLADTGRGIGIVYEGDLQDPRFRLLTVGPLAEENVNLTEALLDTSVRAMRGEDLPDEFDVTLLREPSDPVPLNLNIVPIALVFEVVLLGFTFGAVMIFQEKQEGVNRAYRVSPATTFDYIMARNVMFTVMSIIYGGLLLLAAFRLDAEYGPIMLLVVLTSSMMTLIGLAIAVFFNNISEWFFVGVGVLILNMLPVFSYNVPTFAPRWLTLIPSYPVLFGVREILFPTGKADFLGPLVLQLLVLNVIAFGLSYVAVDRKLMRAA